MKNSQIVFLIIVLGFALVFGGYLLAPQPVSMPVGSQTKTPSQASSPDPLLLNNADAPRIGKKEAKIQLVVFSDYQCPYCKNAHDVINKILDAYPNEVSLVQRSLIVHPPSITLSYAAEAANLQGKFREMNNALFARPVEPNEDAVTTVAKEIGLDVEKFKSDLNSDKVKDRVNKDNSDGEALALTGTPSVFINNETVENFYALDQEVKKRLAK